MEKNSHTKIAIKEDQLQSPLQHEAGLFNMKTTKKKKKYNIRRYQPSDKAKMLQLIGVVWEKLAMESTSKRFDWQYVDNPNNPPEGPIIFIVEEGETIVGLICGIALKLKIQDRIIDTHWCIDFMVHPKKRGKYGVLLAEHIKEEMNYTFGFPVGYTLDFWLRKGARGICQNVVYSRIENFKRAMKNKKGPKWEYILTHIKGKMIKGKKPVAPKISEGIIPVEVFKFDDRLDALWEKASKDYPFIGVRDKNFLNWRFFGCSQFNYTVYLAEKEDEVLGYIVMSNEQRPDIHYGYIVDIFARKGDEGTIVTLLERAIYVFQSIKVDEMKVLLTTSDKCLLRIFNQFGFVFKEIGETGVALPGKLKIKIPDQPDTYVTYADSDLII